MITASVFSCPKWRTKVSPFLYNAYFTLTPAKTFVSSFLVPEIDGRRKSAVVCRCSLGNFGNFEPISRSLNLKYEILEAIEATGGLETEAPESYGAPGGYLSHYASKRIVTSPTSKSLDLTISYNSNTTNLKVLKALKALDPRKLSTELPTKPDINKALKPLPQLSHPLTSRTRHLTSPHKNCPKSRTKKQIKDKALKPLPQLPYPLTSCARHFTSPHKNCPKNRNRKQIKELVEAPKGSHNNMLCVSDYSLHRFYKAYWIKRLSQDVEVNPGPEEATLLVTSYNVRGLGDEKKARHLVNSIYKMDRGKNVDNIVCLQETFTTTPGKLPYLWRGNLHLTPGTGSSCGCVTLLSSHLNIIHKVDIDNIAHVLVCQKTGEQSASYIIANIYAPNANNMAKLEFFASIFEAATEFSDSYDCPNILLAGDFNLIFDGKEGKNRTYSAQEKRIACFVRDQTRASQLSDSWENKTLFTWRRPNSDIFSTIDRILYSSDKLKLKDIDTNWSLGFSDHAAVTASFTRRDKTQLPRSKITRLDPLLARSQMYSEEITQGFDSMITTMPPDWNPHLKLEFAKMCIRTVVERVQANRKAKERCEEDLVNEELEIAIHKLAEGNIDSSNTLIDHTEELRARKQTLIEEKGSRLAEKLGTKWFNEGEKSSKYFLRLLNRALPDNFEVVQGENGEILNDPKDIEDAIVKFYKDLYENDNVVEQDDDEFFNEINPISAPDDAQISARLTTADLLMTLQTCQDTAPGPDGIPYSIIKLLWPTYGELLCNAWQYSLEIKCLPPSHKVSFLKLIPKAGKDLKRLTNWRPITLSNCDHKLITKTYSKRLCDRVTEKNQR